MCYKSHNAFTIGGSILTLDVSENSSLWTEESLTTLDEENLSNLPLSLELEAISEELANKGPIQTEVQLRYIEYYRLLVLFKLLDLTVKYKYAIKCLNYQFLFSPVTNCAHFNSLLASLLKMSRNL